MYHEVSRTEELAERRRARGVDHAGLEEEEHRAWYVLAARGLVVKHVYAAELRVVTAAVLAADADAVLVAQPLLKLGTISREKSSLEAGSKREKKGREKRRNVRNSVR
jgi:hypothetical protein